MESVSVSSEEGSGDSRRSYSMSADVSELGSSIGDFAEEDEGLSSVAAGSSTPFTQSFTFPLIGGKDVLLWDEKPPLKPSSDSSEMEMMKERFSKLLLGEDMSGGGKGVCSALAISNAITNLSATVFGELWRLEPVAPQKKAMWCREMEWLLSVSDSIVELVPKIQEVPGGGTYEVMASNQRSDLRLNLPALKKLDAMLLSILDGFCDMEFWYVDRGIVVDDYDKYSSGALSGRPSVRQEEKWWLPCPKVPTKGLSEESRKRLQQCRDCTNQILKAALAINNNVLAEMDIPTAYLQSLPKKGKDCLGDIIYRYITADQFSPDCLIDCLNLSSEFHTQDVANRIEAAVHVWKLKERKKHPNSQIYMRKLWGDKVKGFAADGHKNLFLAQRAETLLQSLRLRFPGLPQTALDMSKIQYNKDVGHAILESYSRVMESLAFNIIARIDDVLYVDDANQQCTAAESMPIFNRGGGFNGLPIQKKMTPSPFSIQPTPYASPFATPTFCSSPPLPGSPKKCVTPAKKSEEEQDAAHKVVASGELDKLWAYAGNLGPRRLPGGAPERD